MRLDGSRCSNCHSAAAPHFTDHRPWVFELVWFLSVNQDCALNLSSYFVPRQSPESSSNINPKSAMGFWTTRSCGVDSGFQPRFVSRGGRRRVGGPRDSDFVHRLWLCRGVFLRDFPVSGFSDVTDRENGRAKRSRGFWNGSFPHDCGAALADRAERVQHGCADLQIQPPTMANDLARRLEQPPARTVCTCERSHPLPSAAERKPRYRL